MTTKNDITGDSIQSRHSGQKKYADNWEKIFGKKKGQAQQDLPSAEDIQKQKEQVQDPRNG
tara:strand:+ start:864 stop:1046 length:183 start_codon:yes stop_codon:yes gene_type:complete